MTKFGRWLATGFFCLHISRVLLRLEIVLGGDWKEVYPLLL